MWNSMAACRYSLLVLCLLCVWAALTPHSLAQLSCDKRKCFIIPHMNGQIPDGSGGKVTANIYCQIQSKDGTKGNVYTGSAAFFGYGMNAKTDGGTFGAFPGNIAECEGTPHCADRDNPRSGDTTKVTSGFTNFTWPDTCVKLPSGGGG